MADENATSTNINIEEVLKKQNDEFEQKLQKQKEEMQAKLDAMTGVNEQLTQELDNLKTNTATENALLGEQIAKISPETVKSSYDPYDKHVLYSVYNENAKITTLMTGDEVEGIVGLDLYITEDLKNGKKNFKKYPYEVNLYEKKDKNNSKQEKKQQ